MLTDTSIFAFLAGVGAGVIGMGWATHARTALDRAEIASLKARRDAEKNFAQLSSEALDNNASSFLRLAQQSLGAFQERASGDLEKRQTAIDATLKPVSDHMRKLEEQVAQLEKQRGIAYGELRAQVGNLLESQQQMLKSSEQLRNETTKLSTSLRSSSVRGRWGELQLRNVIELAGMSSHCDFTEQTTFTTESGAVQRPDVIVRLPRGNSIVVDAKAPLSAYLDAVDAGSDDERMRYLRLHAKQLRDHCTGLSRKSYWQQFDQSPEFVVLFLPGEMFFSAALEQDRDLLEWSLEQNIILSTPTTLIALLRAVAQGWREAALEQNAREVSELGRQLYESLAKMTSHINKLQKSLSGSVDAYNAFVGSLESRVLPRARKFRDLKVIAENVAEPVAQMIEPSPRLFAALEAGEELEEASVPST
jgi:DNA recombination protein RmuC